MSRRWRLTPASLSFPPEDISLFWVFKRRPRPALEMYSRPAQSRVTVPETLSRKACAAGHCAASRRPAIRTVPGAPWSILSILRFRLPESDAAGPRLGRIVVVDAVHHLAHEVDAEAARLALLQRQPGVGLWRASDVESLGVAVDERHFDAAGDAGDVDAYRHVAGRPVLHDVGEKLLEHEVHRPGKPGPHGLRREREDRRQGIEAPPEAARRRGAGALHEDDRHVVLLRRARGERAYFVEQHGAKLGHGFPVVACEQLAHARLAELLAGRVGVLEDAVGDEREHVARLELDRGRRPQPLERHRGEREAGGLVVDAGAARRAIAEDRRLPAAVEA